jgi:hypothetical protein
MAGCYLTRRRTGLPDVAARRQDVFLERCALLGFIGLDRFSGFLEIRSPGSDPSSPISFVFRGFRPRQGVEQPLQMPWPTIARAGPAALPSGSFET